MFTTHSRCIWALRSALGYILAVLVLAVCTAHAQTNYSERLVRSLLTRRDSNDLVQLPIAQTNGSASSYCNLCCINVQRNVVGKHCGSHTLCRYPANVSGPSCRGYLPIRFTFMEQEAIVDMHNTIRSHVSHGLEMRSRNRSASAQQQQQGQPMAANMRALQWSDELATIAERWVAQCIYGNDICRDLEQYPVGQNIGRGDLAHSNELKLIQKWQSEAAYFPPDYVTQYRFSHKGRNRFSRYTQIVWADTYLVGCARAIFQKSKGPNVYYSSHLVCNYGPAGNIPNQGVYKVGAPCTACPEGTACSLMWNGLCVSETNEELFDYVETGQRLEIAASTPNDCPVNYARGYVIVLGSLLIYVRIEALMQLDVERTVRIRN